MLRDRFEHSVGIAHPRCYFTLGFKQTRGLFLATVPGERIVEQVDFDLRHSLLQPISSRTPPTPPGAPGPLVRQQRRDPLLRRGEAVERHPVIGLALVKAMAEIVDDRILIDEAR